MLGLDRWTEQLQWSWLKTLRIGPEDIRQVLTVTTGATMTITGVVFSVTVFSRNRRSHSRSDAARAHFTSVRANLLVGRFGHHHPYRIGHATIVRTFHKAYRFRRCRVPVSQH
jgi:uncharacterized membrane protein